MPPMYSALKHAGKPLYDYARAGVDIERAPRRVIIHALELQRFEGEQLEISVCLQQGHLYPLDRARYGRSAGLRRASGRLAPHRGRRDSASTARITLEELEAMPATARDALLLPLDTLLQDLPEVRLDAAQQAALPAGQAVAWSGLSQAACARLRGQRRAFSAWAKWMLTGSSVPGA